MKALKLWLAVSTLSRLAAALPSNLINSTAPDAPLGGTLITDPARIAYLMTLHDDALDKMKHGEETPVGTAQEAAEVLVNGDPHEKRFIPIIGIGGLVLVQSLTIVSRIIDDIVDSLLSLFTGEDIVWSEKGRCRAEYDTWAGWKGTFRSWHREKGGDASEVFEHNIAWNNPGPMNAPRVDFFENDYLGLYSVQMTATNTYAWPGIDGTRTCIVQGICHPQYIFYRRGYNIVLNTWQSQGIISDCQYKKNCGGLCFDRVKDQTTSGGNIWSGKCAVPCKEDGPDGYEGVLLENPRLMVVGDSISHGMEDDFTWRWRLFYWIQDVLGRKPMMVGPFGGTHGPLPRGAARPQPPLFPGEPPFETYEHMPGLYNQGVPQYFSYGQQHAAWWGRQAAQSKNDIQKWVSDHQPDYLLVLLGFNDLGWWVSGPDDLVGNLGQLVNNARQAKPNIKILLGNVVHRTFIGGRQDLVDNTNRFNMLLRERMEGWFRWESPLVYVDVNTNYQCRPHGGCPDAYDGLHPNAMGEYHIAEAFARAFKEHFGYIGPDFNVPSGVEVRVVETPGNVGVSSWPEGLHVSWDITRNARGYDIRSKVQGASGWWSEGQVYPNTMSSWQTWLVNGQTWEYQVRTRSEHQNSAWSGSVSATANIQTSTGPANIAVVPVGGDGMTVSWQAVSGGQPVNRYGVIIWDRDTEGAFVEERAAAGTSLHIAGLQPNHRYSVWVTTYVNLPGNPKPAGGLPAAAKDVFVGRGAPAVPAWVNVDNVDPTSVMVSWPATDSASGYGVYIFTMDWQPHGEAFTTDTSYGIGFLFPGTWNYRYCVTAYNGNMESGRTARCKTPPVYPGYEKRDLVNEDEVTMPEGFTDGRLMTNGTIPAANATVPYGAESMFKDVNLKALLNKVMTQQIAIIDEEVTEAIVEAVEALNLDTPTSPEEMHPEEAAPVNLNP